jgi:hypothetical protein
MTNILNSQMMQTAQLDRALEYAVIQSWDQVMPDPTSGLIHVEYETGAAGPLDFLKIWSSTLRGHWSLVCEYWIRPLWSHTTGLRFANDYYSADLARTLEFLIAHEDAFAKLPDRRGSIQVSPPTEEERREAERWMTVALNHDGSVPTEQPMAA